MASEPDPAIRESRAARRLGRLFRIERTGRLARRPAATVRRIIERRGALVAELSRLESRRREVAAAVTAELEAALGELAREVERLRAHSEAALCDLGAELRARGGGGAATGLRDGAGQPRLLGRG